MILRKYLLNNLSQSFFPIFFTLFIINAVIMLLQIAAMTSYIKLDFIELLTFFSYKLPEVTFFILPISVFVALITSLAKLSSQNELIVINALGFKPTRLIRIYFLIAIITSILSLILSIGISEKTKYYYNQFKDKKISEAKFNIKTSQYGQKFGDWLIYIEDKKENIYKNIKLFNKDEQKDSFIIAKTADINMDGVGTNMKLQNGKSFSIANDKIEQVDFGSMVMRDQVLTKPFGSYKDYWSDINKNKRKAKQFARYVLFSLFPLLSIFFIISLGYYNPRYENNNSSKNAIIAILVFYILTYKLSSIYTINAIYIISSIWFIAGYIHYRMKVKKLY
jgi:lipopolysaccharide export system permease protein